MVWEKGERGGGGMKKTICDVRGCGKELSLRNNYGGYFEYRGPNPVTWARGFDFCEEHGQ